MKCLEEVEVLCKMKIGKYDIKIEKKAVIAFWVQYSILFTWFVFLTDNSKLQCFFIAICTAIVVFVWEIFWFNYYEHKNQEKLLSKEKGVEECDATGLN